MKPVNWFRTFLAVAILACLFMQLFLANRLNEIESDILSISTEIHK